LNLKLKAEGREQAARGSEEVRSHFGDLVGETYEECDFLSVQLESLRRDR
jgi:hypothetical protein